MSRYFSLGLISLVAGTLALLSPWLAPSGAAACGVPTMPVGPEVSIDGAPRFIWPLRGTLVSDICSNGSERRFNGIDIAVPEGTKVVAAADGIVLYAGEELKGVGNVVLIRHDGDWVTAYAYAESLLVKRGNVVRQGRPVALSGRSIALGTPLLHFEIRKQSRPVDPLRLLPQRRDG